MFHVGQTVKYVFYGVEETAVIDRISGSGAILFFTNGRWMHATSCVPVQRRLIGYPIVSTNAPRKGKP